MSTHKKRAEIRSLAAADLEAGMTKEEVANKYIRTVSWVRGVITEFNVAVKRKVNNPVIILAALAAGISQSEISKQRGVSKQYVGQIKREFDEAFSRYVGGTEDPVYNGKGGGDQVSGDDGGHP
jgi:transposase